MGIKAILFLLIILFLVLSGCGPVGLVGSFQTAIAITQTPLPTATPTCAPVVDLTTEPLMVSPQLIVILIQPSDWADDTYVPQINQIITDVLPSIVEPGDSIAIFEMGTRDFGKAAILYDKAGANLAQPEIPPTPTPHETFTPFPTFTESPYTVENRKIHNAGTATAESANATATQYAFQDLCSQASWVSSYGETATAWASTKAASDSSFTTQIKEELNSYKDGGNQRATPVPHMIFESLSHATLTFQSECSHYWRCILVMFSNLDDWRMQSPPDYLKIDLSNVEVYGALLNCNTLFQPDCAAIQKIWGPYFRSHGAVNVKYSAGPNIENNLIAFLRR